MSGEGILPGWRGMRPVAADTDLPGADPATLPAANRSGKRVTRKDAPPGYLPFCAIAFDSTSEEMAATVARAMDRA